MKPKLDKWLVYGNCLVGYLYDSPAFPAGTRIKTDAIRFVDIINSEATCSDGVYTLLEAGTPEDHKKEILKPGERVGGLTVGDFTKTKPVVPKKVIIGV